MSNLLSIKKMVRTSPLMIRYSANNLANHAKRSDLVAAQFAQMLFLAKIQSLKGKTCLEIGGGWVLSHAIICYLLGAKKIVVTDIFPYAYPESLKIALHRSELPMIRDLLAPFNEHNEIREKLEELMSIQKFSFKTLEKLGIYYKAPIDIAKEKLEEYFDFIYSFSVLEHIPIDDIKPLLKNLAKSLNSDGIMIHTIHLEDHKDYQNKPFEFYSESGEYYNREEQTKRGNRIRKSQWIQLLSDMEGIDFHILYEYKRLNKNLPENINKTMIYTDGDDLFISHLGLFIKKN